MAAARAAKAFIDAPAGELVAAFDPGRRRLGKERVRAALASIGGVAGGFRTRMADFAPEPARHLGDEPPRPVAIQDARRRRLARRRVRCRRRRRRRSPGRAPTIPRRWVWRCRWRRISMAPSNRDFHGCKSALRTWHADATALTHPKIGPDGRKTRPRWLVGEYAFLRFLWRSSQAAYHAGGPGARPPRIARIARSWRRYSVCPCTSTSRCATTRGVWWNSARNDRPRRQSFARPLATRWRRRPRTRIGAWRRARCSSPR